MKKTYSVAMGAVVAGESASLKSSAILREIIGSRCCAQFAGGKLEEVVHDGFVLSYLPDLATVDSAISALRDAGVRDALVVSEEIDNGEIIEICDVKTIPAAGGEKKMERTYSGGQKMKNISVSAAAIDGALWKMRFNCERLDAAGDGNDRAIWAYYAVCRYVG